MHKSGTAPGITDPEGNLKYNSTRNSCSRCINYKRTVDNINKALFFSQKSFKNLLSRKNTVDNSFVGREQPV